MRRLLVVTAVLAAALIGATSLWAARSGSDRSSVTIAGLQREIADLQRKIRIQGTLDAQYTTEILTLQHETLNLQTHDRQHATDILALQTRKPQAAVTLSPGGPAIVQPGSWGSAIAGPCLNGVLIGGGYSTDYPALVGTGHLTGSSFWEVHVFNPLNSGHSIVLSPQAVCLSLG
jgi:hypothetical protein